MKITQIIEGTVILLAIVIFCLVTIFFLGETIAAFGIRDLGIPETMLGADTKRLFGLQAVLIFTSAGIGSKLF